jgi:hypothetical protein
MLEIADPIRIGCPEWLEEYAFGQPRLFPGGGTRAYRVYAMADKTSE